MLEVGKIYSSCLVPMNKRCIFLVLLRIIEILRYLGMFVQVLSTANVHFIFVHVCAWLFSDKKQEPPKYM